MSEIKKDHCTGFPEVWVGVDISDCCKQHDETLGTRIFYRCLKAKIGRFHASYITIGGAIGAWVKYTKIMIKRVK
jgi:hypothetical protein